MNSILVVCEGNICRSPMAEGLFSVSLPDMRVQSAGLQALIGMPAHEICVRLMQERGIDIREHRATQITLDACRKAELIIVMSMEQRKRLEAHYPFTSGRVFRLGEFHNKDVPDPYRRPVATFLDALQLIEEGVSEWLRRIRKI